MPNERHRTSTFRRAWRWLGGALLLVVLAAGVCEWLAWPFLRGPLERGLEKGTGREVAVGQGFGVRLFGSVRAHGDTLAVGPPPDGPHLQNDAGQPRDFLQLRGFAVQVPYSTVLALWRPKPDAVLRVRSLEVDALDLALVRDADGRANWQFGDKPKEPKQEDTELPQFERLVVREARIDIDDAVTRLDLEARLRTNEGSGGTAATARPASSAPASADSDRRSGVGAGIPGERQAPSEAPAERPLRGLEASATGTYRDAKVQAELRTTGLLPLAAGGTEAEPLPLVIDLKVGETEAHVDGTARDLLALSALDARFRLAGPSLDAVGDSIGMTLPTTAAFETNGRVRKEGDTWQLDVARLAVGSSRLQADLAFDLAPSVPRLSGSLGGSRLALVDLAPAFGAPAKAKKKPKAATPQEDRERVLPQREFDLPSLAQMEADLELEFKEVDLGTSALEPFAPLNGRLHLKDSRLSIDDLLARNSGGELRGALSLDAQNEKLPVWNVDLRWSGIRLERFVKAGEGRDTQAGTPAESGYVGGLLSGGAKLEGRGRSTAQMLGSLDGSTQWWISRGHMSHLLLEVAGIDIAEGLGLVIGGDEQLPVQCALARTTVDDGRMTIDVGVVDTPDTTVLVSGGVALGQETLDLRLAANPKDFSPLALRTPVRIEGTFAQPDVSVEKGRLAVRALAGAALAALVTPVAGLLALIDLGEEEKAVCQKAVQRLQEGTGRAKPGGKPAAKPGSRQ